MSTTKKRYSVSYSDDGETWVHYETDKIPKYNHAIMHVSLNTVIKLSDLTKALEAYNHEDR